MRISTIALGLLLVHPGWALAQGAYVDRKGAPLSPAEARAAEVLEVLSSADPARVTTLVETSFAQGLRESMPLAEHRGVLAELARERGKLTLHGFRTYDPPRPATMAFAIVHVEVTDSWEAIVVEVEDADPHRITSLRMTPARPPSDLPQPGPLTQDEALAALEAHVERLARADAFSGTVMVARGGKVLWQRATGEADRGFHAKVTQDTRFNLGSMNKMFTAVAIAQLAEAGKLSFSDPVSKWLGGEWIAKSAADRIRIEHLLTHTSGLGSYFNDTWEAASRARYRQVADWKPLVADDKPAFEPGSDWSYSNTGFLLLGAIVEKASGQDYYDYIREHVYAPAGMSRTDCYDVDAPIENLATGYTRSAPTPLSGGSPWRSNVFMHVARGGPAGGGYSTTPDLMAFAEALMAGKLVSKAMLERLWSPKPELHSPGYGYGFVIEGTPGHRIVGHSGGFPGINGQLDLHLDDGWTVAVLANNDRGAQVVGGKARELLARVGR